MESRPQKFFPGAKKKKENFFCGKSFPEILKIIMSKFGAAKHHFDPFFFPRTGSGLREDRGAFFPAAGKRAFFPGKKRLIFAGDNPNPVQVTSDESKSLRRFAPSGNGER